jgi:hypothetical protein
MRGDIIRALIETITNSDDAYGDRNGKIRIEVEHRHGPKRVITRDRAKGMTSARMKAAMTRLGGRTSGFEAGESVRGNLGRGAKDLAAFGQVAFESICDGRYSRLTLEQTGDYHLASERDATDEDREALHIPKGNGTVVTIYVTENNRCPRHARLIEKLTKHYQLRDILSDSRREVYLVDLNRDESVTLRHAHPPLQVVFSGEVGIDGYPEATAVITIYRNHERFDEPASDPCRPGGLLIKGRRAIYENTYFRFESNPHAGWFSGRVECPFIDELARQYDQRLEEGKNQDERNPIPIITRRRDGLQQAHPFYRVLATAVEKPLGDLIALEERKAREEAAGESTAMRRSLDVLGRDLAKLIDEDLREIDEEGLPGGPEDGPNVPPIRLIPEQAVLYMGEDKTLTVQVRAQLKEEEVVCVVDPAGVVELVDGSKAKLFPHRRRADVLTAQIRLRPLLEDEETLLSVTCGEHSAVALIEVRREREIIEFPLPQPDGLQFEKDGYRLTWTKRKKLRVLAPVELVDQEGKALRVTSSDPGVPVLGQRVELKLDEEAECYFADTVVEARTLATKATLRADLGSVTATCNVIVVQDEAGPNLEIRIVDEEAGNYRAIVEGDGGKRIIKIMGRHPTMRRYRGPAPDFPGEKLSGTQMLVAEIVAGEASRMVMERKFRAGSGGEQLDAARLYVEHHRYLSKYLTRCHRALVPDARLS